MATMFTTLSLHQLPFRDSSSRLRRTSIPLRAGKIQPLNLPVDAIAVQTANHHVPAILRMGRFPAARTVQQMMDTMERMMEDPVLSETDVGLFNGHRWGGRSPWDIKESERDYKMRFDLPGMMKNDVRIWVEDGMLVIKAEKPEAEKDETDWPAANFGKYSSRIALPENVVVGEIGAEVRDGVLYVTVPKAAPSSKVLNIDVQ